MSTFASLLFLAGNSCHTENEPTFGVQISTTIPSFVSDGTKLTLKAVTTNASPGDVIFAWRKISGPEGVVLSEATKAETVLTLPSLPDSDCDAVLKIQLAATDSSQKSATLTQDIHISKRWCTYTATVGELLDDDVRKLALDPGGKLWIGTKSGLNSLDATGAWTTLTYDTNAWFGHRAGSITANVVCNVVHALYARADGVWMSVCQDYGRFCAGIQHLSGDPTREASWVRYSGDEETLSPRNYKVLRRNSNRILDIGENEAGNILAVGYGIAAIDTSNHVNLFELRYPTEFGRQAKGPQNTNWYAGLTGGLVAYRGESETLIENGFSWGGGIYTYVRAMVQDSYGNMWLGLSGEGGLVRYIPPSAGSALKGTWTQTVFYPTSDQADVRAMALDKSGNIWVATQAGLGKIAKDFVPGAEELDPLIRSSAVRDQGGFLVDDLQDLSYEGKTDTLWIATKGGGLTRLRVGLLPSI